MLCEGSFLRKTHFFFSTANAHAPLSRRSRRRDDARKERWSDTVLFSNYKHFRREY